MASAMPTPTLLAQTETFEKLPLATRHCESVVRQIDYRCESTAPARPLLAAWSLTLRTSRSCSISLLVDAGHAVVPCRPYLRDAKS